jgi:flagellar biosynthesis anti-sigma factor FlgM
MEINNSYDSLKSLLGVNTTTSAQSSSKGGATTGGSTWGSDSATLSSAASQMSLSAGDDGVRMDKVSSIQSAIAAGTYNIPASAVATKMVDAMLGNS